MNRFKNWRRRTGALALLPAIAFLAAPAADAEPGAGAASLDAGAKRVAVGGTFKLRGRFAPRSAPATATAPVATGSTAPEPVPPRYVRIEFRPAGEPAWRKVRVVKTDRKGRFARAVRVKRSGRYRAVSPDGRATEPIRIRAKARVRARVAGRLAHSGEKVAVKGTVVPGAGRRVVVEVGDDVVKTRSGRGGRFKAAWRASGVGSERVRVKVKSDRIAAGAKTRAGKVTVLRPAAASWYGPGLYGNRTACGQTLTTSIVGVAHKTMPCGTKLTIQYGNRSVRAEVIDRGPFHPSREFDLTSATKQKLGFGDVGTVWVSR